MKRAAALALLICLAATGAAIADPVTDHYNAGNRFYEQKDYAQALASYQAAVDAGGDDPDLYLNLGNAAFRVGETGVAVWAYRMGLRLAPRDGDLRFNLRYAQATLRDELPQPEQVWVVRAAEAVAGWFTPGEALGVAALAWLLLGLTAMLWGPWRQRRGWLLVLGIGALTALAIFGPLAGYRLHEQYGRRQGIVTAAETVVRTAPAEDAPEAFKIHAGLALRIIEDRDRYARVAIPTGLEGWIPLADYRFLRP
ncbi:MAG: tetratricopeptide repeat protein [Myxococcales bacterium]|nr:tetratricopeptide repeat protein [Myxococcales bacterium]